VFTSPAAANGVVYIGCDDDNLYAFNANTGASLWTAATGGILRSAVAIANAVAYIGSDDTKLYAFNAGTGAVLWTAATGDAVRSSPP
jgi:outer membrane protein assembly factor BamB